MRLTCELVVTQIGNDFVAVPITSGKDSFRGIVRLNESGAMIVNCLMEGKSIGEIADQILSEYDGVTRETAEKAILSVLNKLKSVGIIED